MKEKIKEIDKYITLSKPHRSETKVKGSKFIASATNVSDKTSAIEFLETIRGEYFDATHNCFAYRIGYDGMEYRASDDGEPKGSAGKPILFSITKFNLSDVIVVVTRYFGGAKLGVGGLARAYSEAADLVLSGCEFKTIHRTLTIRVLCVYEDISLIKRLIDEYAVSFKEYYSDAVEFLVEVHITKTEEFIGKVSSMTNTCAGAMLYDNK